MTAAGLPFSVVTRHLLLLLFFVLGSTWRVSCSELTKDLPEQGQS